MKFELKYKTFHYENAFESVVCEIVAISSRGRWVNSSWPGVAYMRPEKQLLFP